MLLLKSHSKPFFYFIFKIIFYTLSQEKKRLREKYAASPHDDLAICKNNLALHMDWVMNGDEKSDRDPDSNTYPLPHNAYGDRLKQGQSQTQDQTKDSRIDSSKELPEAGPPDENKTAQNGIAAHNGLVAMVANHEADDNGNASRQPCSQSDIDHFFNK